MEISYELNEVQIVANQILSNLTSKVLLFYGDMGTGKTTLIKALIKALECQDEVTSPTFSIVNEYRLRNDTIYHFDLYRINDIEEAYNFGIEDYLDSGSWILIEWPDIIKDILPNDFNKIEIILNNDKTRTLKLIIN